MEDLKILDRAPKTRYVCRRTSAAYEERSSRSGGARSLRDTAVRRDDPESGTHAYEAGVFTEFMEQRAPGHTVLDDKIYH